MPYSTENASFMKKLPTAIFTLIKEYLTPNDYNQMLNSNHSLFKEIKRSIFNISEYGMKNENEYRLDKNEFQNHIELRFERFYHKRKQFEEDNRLSLLKLDVCDVPENVLLKYASFFANIYNIRVAYPGPVSAEFDFSVFNNINTVTLDCFQGLKKISKGLENIQQLSICNFQDLVSIDCPLVGFDSLSLIECNQLQFIQSLQDIKEITILQCEELFLDFSNLKDSLKKLTLDKVHIDVRLSELPCRSLQYLNISEFKKTSEDDFNLLINISNLELIGDSISALSEFPLFYGKVLSLRNYRLSAAWTIGIRLENLKFLSLENCPNCMELPIFPRVEVLNLTRLDDLIEIRSESFPQCKRMKIENCCELRVIHQLPKVKSIMIRFCGSFEELIGFNEIDFRLKMIYLENLFSFSKMVCLRNIPEITIMKCEETSLNFDGFDQSSLSNEKRKVILDSCDFIKDLRGLGNIGKLEICGGSGLLNGQGIHDIDHLIIRNVPHLKSFKNFIGLKRVDLYRGLDNLVSLEGLQQVPMVSLFFIQRFSLVVTPGKQELKPINPLSPKGLEGCGQVYCGDSLVMALEAQKYVKDHSSTSFAEIFDTIKEFYLVHHQGNCDNWNDAEKIRLW